MCRAAASPTTRNSSRLFEARRLAPWRPDWLTSPETQIKAFNNAGTFPSQPEAQSSPDLTGSVNEYFNNAPSGQIGIDRANAITVTTFKGPKYFQFHDALGNAITRVFDGIEDKETSWKTWVTEVGAF